MERPDSIARRRALALAGSATATALAAGCLSDDEAAADDGETSSDDGSDNGDSDDAAERDEADEDDESTETDAKGDAWADVEEIRLSATTSRFEGVEPEFIEGEENPTLVLTEGEEYVITWVNADGKSHNLELWDEDETVVDGHSTEVMGEKNETRSLEFEADAAMSEYICRIHVDWGKRGDIEIATGDRD
ncbi:hypothetical protein HALLA_14725 [Halostagnicola larsenii XH-48]|uniref:Blue (type 1) copper domain-containing protein n=1 Tax=Halostagnicola larsenii XH-48 TaxID=797299 RepID=W0JRR3_9EURY|nr:hypothetical protein [Halostagnicola larsenii]AHF99854.1 hypothetical protein HALLA_14725 [Halostagnicola larsenii XH-48]